MVAWVVTELRPSRMSVGKVTRVQASGNGVDGTADESDPESCSRVRKVGRGY
jgi:hypothetical protein